MVGRGGWGGGRMGRDGPDPMAGFRHGMPFRLSGGWGIWCFQFRIKNGDF